MFEQCITEIEELHEFFMQWISGKLEKTEENFLRFSGSIADDFEIISPGGTTMKRDELVPFLFDWHGSRADDESYRIWIENARVRFRDMTTILIVYEECQTIDGENTRRYASSIFSRDDSRPNGVAWRHVHETWAA